MPKFDVTKLSVAIDRLLETTTNPRHRFMLQASSRHRYLEVAGRYEEIFAPDMMSMHPFYVFKAAGNDASLGGQDNVKSLYRFWAETNQSIFFVEDEEVAVADHFICSVAMMFQQVSGKVFKAKQTNGSFAEYGLRKNPKKAARSKGPQGRRERHVSVPDQNRNGVAL
jgi:hypothetical protein